jgi:hypothetical protein
MEAFLASKATRLGKVLQNRDWAYAENFNLHRRGLLRGIKLVAPRVARAPQPRSAENWYHSHRSKSKKPVSEFLTCPVEAGEERARGNPHQPQLPDNMVAFP